MGSVPDFYLVEKLTIPAALFVVLPVILRDRMTRGSHLYYVEGHPWAIFGVGKCLLRWNISVERLDFCLIDVRDEKDDLVRLVLSYQDLARILDQIVQRESFQKVAQYSGASGSHLFIYLKKRAITFSFNAENALWRMLFLTHLLRWKTQESGKDGRRILFAQKRIWMREAVSYARLLGIDIIAIPRLFLVMKEFIIKSFGEHQVRQVYRRFLNLRRKMRIIWHGTLLGQRSGGGGESCLIIEYNGQLNLDYPECHSDFFFSPYISRKENVIALFNQPNDPLTGLMAKELRRWGIYPVSLSPRATTQPDVDVYSAPFWPCAYSPNILTETGTDEPLVRQWIKQETRNYFQELQYWKGFFKHYSARLYLTWYKYEANHCVLAEALRQVGGVTALYQRAFEEFPSPETAVGADVFFGFSRWGADVELRAGSRIPYYVVTGYLGDHRFKLLRKQAEQLKAKIRQNGAQHILAFFDENSHADPRWSLGHEFTQLNYEFILKKVLEETWFGLILKPKASKTLHRRLGSVSGLLDQALATGRCIVIGEVLGAGHNIYPPALASMAADVAVHGHLTAATAGFEAFLSGTPALLLDRERWHRSRFYSLGKGRVVFNDWEELWRTCCEYWRNPAGVPEFGDWSSMIHELDPFRDGRAVQRMGTYLKWLLDDLRQGYSRDAALVDAAKRYAEIWGEDKIIRNVGI